MYLQRDRHFTVFRLTNELRVNEELEPAYVIEDAVDRPGAVMKATRIMTDHVRGSAVLRTSVKNRRRPERFGHPMVFDVTRAARRSPWIKVVTMIDIDCWPS